MANPRKRFSPQTIDDLDNLGQRCGIDDHDTLIRLLIRKYGDQLTAILAPDNPNEVRLSQSVPTIAKPDPAPLSTVPMNASAHAKPIAPIAVESIEVEAKPATVEPSRPETPADELARLRALKPMERMKYSARITELKALVEA